MLIWYLGGLRISSMTGAKVVQQTKNELKIEVRHLKGANVNRITVSIDCNCKNASRSAASSLFCPLHSQSYGHQQIEWPLSRNQLGRIIQKTGGTAHSPRTSLACAIHNRRMACKEAKKLLYIRFINYVFLWASEKSDSLFLRYSQQSGLPGSENSIPIYSILRQADRIAWKQGKREDFPYHAWIPRAAPSIEKTINSLNFTIM